MSKEYTDESIRLKANEALLASKGFILYVVNADGSLAYMGNTSGLNAAERYGLQSFCYEHTSHPEEE